MYYENLNRQDTTSRWVAKMPQNPSATIAEEERAELESVIGALSRWPRLSELLRYIGDKVLNGAVDEINEYNIATEVLGRSKTTFDSTEDAIARVETHRLRKRLAEFYQGEGSSHPIQVSLPPGSYVPVFVRRSEVVPAQRGGSARAPADHITKQVTQPPVQGLASHRRYLLLAALLLAAALGGTLYFRTREVHEAKGTNANPVTASTSSASPAAFVPIRLLAGYYGQPRTDTAGRVWGPDKFFAAGGNWQRSSAAIARTSDPFIFEHSRTGDFSYNIPLKPGVYELHLFFSVSNSDVVATFNVRLNGQTVLRAFDINIDALGADIGDERVFRDVSPAADGYLHIEFAGEMAPPSLNAIEVLPGTPHAQLPVRLVMQSTSQTDNKGQFWHPDDYFMNGQLARQTHLLEDSVDPDLFSGERYGHFTYAIPVDARDNYTLVLHFAEFYFNTATTSDSGRLFKVMCNGQTLLDNFDVFKEAGHLHELTKTFHHLKPSPQGKINLEFEPIRNNATISGIEVIDESQ